ncbi:MAG: POTRA domain-containing protein, partial [Bacteroidota bacterium]
MSGLLNAQKIEHHFKGITTSKGNPKELLLELQNSGYAFARLELDTILEKTDTSFLIWTVIPGNLLILDSLNFNSAHIRKKNLERILDFKRGDLFNQTKINKITERLSNAYGIRPSKQPQVLFFKNTFQLEIQTEKTKKNRIEGLLQLQNNAVTNKTTLTGNVELDVSNVLKTCERFQFLWKRPTSKTQYLETSVQLP